MTNNDLGSVTGVVLQELNDSILARLRQNAETACRHATRWRGCVSHRQELECLADTYAEHTITLCAVVAEVERLNAKVIIGATPLDEAVNRIKLLGHRFDSVMGALEKTNELLHEFHDATVIGVA